MREKIEKFLKKEYPNINFEVFYPQEGFGDYSTNIAFLLAKKRGGNFKKTAEEILKKLKEKFKEFEKIKIAGGGFINFYLSKNFLKNELKKIYKNRNRVKKLNLGKRKKIIIEYSQPNIAKKMHVGHLRSTIIGDALANIYDFLGYKVIRWNYLGDWGTQFGKLIAAYKLWGDKERVKKNPIEELSNLYVKFHQKLKKEPSLEKIGREEFRKLEEGDKENRKLWQLFKKESLKEFNKIYKILGVKFDTYLSESFFEKDSKNLVLELKNRGIAEESQGSLIINLKKFNLPPALIQKSDGTSLYLTRDIASLKYRISKFKPAKILYVVGNEQSLHFDQFFAIAKILGLDKTELLHIKFGLILGENKKKFSTREGRGVPLEKLINKAIDLAKKIVAEKNPNLSEKEKNLIAKTVAIGSLKYYNLKEHRNSDIVFDWKKMLDFSGASGSYLQYTYARLSSIIEKAPKIGETNFDYLDNELKLDIVRKLFILNDVIITSGYNYLPNHLALHLYKLANLINKFYEITPILKDENKKRRNLHLILINSARQYLKIGLNLLGIEVLERI